MNSIKIVWGQMVDKEPESLNTICHHYLGLIIAHIVAHRSILQNGEELHFHLPPSVLHPSLLHTELYFNTKNKKALL